MNGNKNLNRNKLNLCQISNTIVQKKEIQVTKIQWFLTVFFFNVKPVYSIEKKHLQAVKNSMWQSFQLSYW